MPLHCALSVVGLKCTSSANTLGKFRVVSSHCERIVLSTVQFVPSFFCLVLF